MRRSFIRCLLFVLSVGWPATLLAQQEPVGDEFQVNTYTPGRQAVPEIAMTESGESVVVWESDGSPEDDNSDESIQGRRYDSSGSAVGDQFQINSLTDFEQQAPSVAMDSAGNFVVVWDSFVTYGTDGGYAFTSIQGQRFDASGNAVGIQFQVNTYTTGPQDDAAVAMDPDGNFVVVWQSDGSSGGDNSSLSVQGQLFNSTGSAVGDEFQVNTYGADKQTQPSVAMDAQGDFVVVWESVGSSGTDSSGQSIQGQRFDSSGTAVGDEFQVNSYTADKQEVPSVAVDAEGGFVVTWGSVGSPGDDDSEKSIQGQLYDASGAALGDQFQINTYTTGLQTLPRLSIDAEGNFVVTWTSDGSPGGDDSSFSVQGRRYSSSGIALGDQFQVNSYTESIQFYSTSASDGLGDFFVVWFGVPTAGVAGNDDSVSSIQAQRYRATGAVGDRVWHDENGDGIQDAGEPGISGVGVDLYDDFGVLVESTVTDADGEYFFEQLTPGDLFFLDVAPPTDFFFTSQDVGDDSLDSDVDANGETALFAAPSGLDLDLDAGLTSFVVGDRVWRDGNENGVQDGGEEGVAGVTVTLFDAAGVEMGQTQTDADGHYSIPAALGDYYLEFTLPTDEAFTLRDVGSDDAIDSDAATDGLTVVFTVGGTDTTRDAGLVSMPTAIGDRVWLDADLDGIQDGGEFGVSGVTVELFSFAGVSQGVTATAADGSYAFTGLAEGSYYLAFSVPAGFCYTAQDQGDDDLRDSDVDPVTLTTGEIVLGTGQNDVSWDAGLVPDASIGNRVWLDDGDGLQAGGEAGIKDVTVNLYDAFDALVSSTVTNATGGYSFSPGPGDYYLEVVLPTDMAFAPRDQGSDDAIDSDVFASTGTTAVFGLTAGQVDTSRDAGLEPATIGNRVWLDDNADGRQQPGETGLAGVTVRLLDDADQEVATTTTGTDGVYGFVGIPSGTYRIEVELPAGGTFSAQDVGSDDLIDSDVDPSTGLSSLFEYTAASASRSWDAGLTLGPEIFADGFESGDVSAWSSSVP